MTDQCILAIDQGTSGTKALVVDESQLVIAAASEPIAPDYGSDGRVEIDPEQLWQSVLTAGRSALAKSGRTIGAVALANQGETVLTWDRRTGEPLSPAVVWQDRRADVVCARLGDEEATVRRVSGLRLDSYFAAPKMTWLREQGYQDGVVTTSDSWLLHRLTGTFVTDAATASRTALLDLDAIAWSPELTELFDLDAELLPEIVPCDYSVGTTEAFGADLPVCGVVVDQQAALFAEACHLPGDMKCTYGTGAFVLANTGRQPARPASGLVSCVAWQSAGGTAYCLDGQVYTVGSVVDWLQRLGVIAEPADLDRYATVEPAGREVFVPALAGLAAPYWSADSRGALAGLSLSSGRGEIVSAVLEGLAASVAVLCQAAAVDTGSPLSVLRVDGGLTRCRALMQRQADLLQCPVEVYTDPDATALGAAAFARLGMRWAATEAEAVAGGGGGGTTFVPQCSPADASERLDRWRRGVDLVLQLSSDART